MNDEMDNLNQLAADIRSAASQADHGQAYWAGPLLLRMWADRLSALAQSPEPVAWLDEDGCLIVLRTHMPSAWVDTGRGIPDSWTALAPITHAPPAPTEAEVRERFQVAMLQGASAEDNPRCIWTWHEGIPSLRIGNAPPLEFIREWNGFRAALRPGAKGEGSDAV